MQIGCQQGSTQSSYKADPLKRAKDSDRNNEVLDVRAHFEPILIHSNTRTFSSCHPWGVKKKLNQRRSSLRHHRTNSSKNVLEEKIQDSRSSLRFGSHPGNLTEMTLLEVYRYTVWKHSYINQTWLPFLGWWNLKTIKLLPGRRVR